MPSYLLEKAVAAIVVAAVGEYPVDLHWASDGPADQVQRLGVNFLVKCDPRKGIVRAEVLFKLTGCICDCIVTRFDMFQPHISLQVTKIEVPRMQYWKDADAQFEYDEFNAEFKYI